MTYFFDYAMLSINKTQFRTRQKAVSSPSPQKGNLRITKNYRGIILMAIAAKIYNALLFNHIKPEIKKIFRKNQISFQKNLTYSDTDPQVCAKNLKTILFIDFFKAFDSIQREKMEQMILTYGLLKETVTTIMMLYKNIKAMVYLPDGDRL